MQTPSSARILTGNTRQTAPQLASGMGERELNAHIPFPQPFHTTPTVMVALTGFDIGNGGNARLRIDARDINPNGFTLHILTWYDTKVHSVDVSWVAMVS